MIKKQNSAVTLARNVDKFFDAAKQAQLQKARECQQAGSKIEIKLAGPVALPF